MADDKRNFRSYYYEKVGYRGVEEKKSIEILLKEKPLDVDKLSQFCQRFPVPSMHRAFVWKLLLGVIPPYSEIHDFVVRQRQEQLDDLIHALRITRRIVDETPKSEVFLNVFLLEQGKLKLVDEAQFDETENQDFLAVSLAFGKMFPSDLDAYWLTRNFVKSMARFKENDKMLMDTFSSMLQKEDADLYDHLVHVDALHSLPVRSWHHRCFAGTLHDKSLEKIWDKAIGGSTKILSYVGIAILVCCRRPLLGCRTSSEANQHVSWLTEEASELIVNKAIEMWNKHGDAGRMPN